MLLRLEKFDVPMKMIFRLEDRLQADPERVRLTQALTLNASKPRMGLRGTHGLFGSTEWWRSIHEGKIPLLYRFGVVQRAYVTGQDDTDLNNTIDLMLDDGSVHMIGIYVNNKKDVELVKPGCRVGIVYALDELKQQPAVDGGINYLNIALEMAVSIDGV